jgi:hypothetical protein
MATSSEHTNEERALDALMAAAFRPEDVERPVSEEEARRILENPPALSPEDEQVLAAMGPDFVEKLLKSAEAGCPGAEGAHEALDAEIEEAYAAMNRGREGSELDEKAREEIERKRRELLGEPEPEAGPGEGARDGP